MNHNFFWIYFIIGLLFTTEYSYCLNEKPSKWNIGPVIFSINFDNDPPGIYNNNLLAKDWNNSSGNDGINSGRVSVINRSDPSEGKVLQVFYPVGKYGLSESGAHWNLKLGKIYDQIYCSYWVRFSTNFDFVKEGKLPGLAGGKTNSGGLKPNGADGWSARIIWRKNGKLAQYVYHVDQPGHFGDNFDWKLTKQCYFTPGKWHHLKNIIVMNTPGKKDGIILARFDGKPALEINNIRFRNTASLGIDIFSFSTFFGGDSNEYASKKDGYIWFDNFQICMVE